MVMALINLTVILVPWCLCGWRNTIKVSFLIRLDVCAYMKLRQNVQSFANQPGCAGNFQMPAESRRCAVNQCRLQSKKLKGATISFSNFLPGDDGNGFKL